MIIFTNMKSIYLSLLLTLLNFGLYAQTNNAIDTALKIAEPQETQQTFYAIEQSADFPGGLQNFSRYIGARIVYREVEELIGVSGKVIINFVVDTAGRLTDIVPVSRIGSGCEEEIVNIITNSPRWKPGIQNGRNIKQRMTFPITLNFPKEVISMAEIRKAQNGYLFQIKDTVYDVDHAAAILGENFAGSQVEITLPYTGDEKFNLKKKKEIWLVKIK